MSRKGVALVTGASRGLGRALALELATRGYHVVAAMRDPQAGAELAAAAARTSGSVAIEALDVTDLGAFQAPDDLRLLINNAAYRGPYLPIEETPPGEWERAFATNVFGVAEVTRRCIPSLRRTAGIIGNISSAGIFFPAPFYAVYRASKSALSALSDALSLELAPFGIRVVEVPSGPLDTDMLATSTTRRPADAIDFPHYRDMAARQFASRQEHVPLPIDESARNVIDAVLAVEGPLRRPASPFDVAALETWRTSTDEERLDQIRRGLGLECR